MNKEKFSFYLKEFQENNFVLLIEENIKCLMRSIALLQIFNINNYTYPYSWRKIGNKSHISLVNHNFEHIEEIKNKDNKKNDAFCIITTSQFDNLSDYSLISLINLKLNRKMVIVLREEDVIENKLKGFVRPIKETNLVFTNIYFDYNQLFLDLFDECSKKYNISTQISNSLNLYLYYNAIIFDFIYEQAFNRPIDLILYFFEETLNPIFYLIIETLGNIRENKTKIIEDISGLFPKYFDLSNSDSIKISNKIQNAFYNNQFEYEYWYKENKKKKELLKEIKKFIFSLQEPIRSGFIFHWSNLINHFF